MFGTRLKQLREEMGITQQDLADLLNVVRPTIAGYETKRKEPDFDKIRSLCNYFNVSSDYLLGISNIRNTDIAGSNDKDISGVFCSINTDPKYYNEIQTMQTAFAERFMKLYCDNKLNFDTEENTLGLTHKQITDIKYIRIPNLVELQKISDVFHVSINFLLGLPEYNLTEEELELLEYYNSLSKEDKRLIMGNMVALMKQTNNTNSKNDFMLAEKMMYSNLTKQLSFPNDKNAENNLQ